MIRRRHLLQDHEKIVDLLRRQDRRRLVQNQQVSPAIQRLDNLNALLLTGLPAIESNQPIDPRKTPNDFLTNND